jgi:hypothetical protein
LCFVVLYLETHVFYALECFVNFVPWNPWTLWMLCLALSCILGKTQLS